MDRQSDSADLPSVPSTVYLPWFPLGFPFETPFAVDFLYKVLSRAAGPQGSGMSHDVLVLDRSIKPATAPRTEEELRRSIRTMRGTLRVLQRNIRVICVLPLRADVDVPRERPAWGSVEWMLPELRMLAEAHAQDRDAYEKGPLRFYADPEKGRHVLLYDADPETFDLLFAPYGGAVHGAFGGGGVVLTNVGECLPLSVSQASYETRLDDVIPQGTERTSMVIRQVREEVGRRLSCFLNTECYGRPQPLEGTTLHPLSLFPKPAGEGDAQEALLDADVCEEPTKPFHRPACASPLPFPAQEAPLHPRVVTPQGALCSPTIKMKRQDLPDARATGELSLASLDRASPPPAARPAPLSSSPPPDRSGMRRVRRLQLEGIDDGDRKTPVAPPPAQKKERGG